MVGSDGLKAAVGVLGCEVLALLSIGVGKHTAAVDGLSSSRASTDSRLSNSEDRLRHVLVAFVQVLLGRQSQLLDFREEAVPIAEL